jgi:superfamily II DNA/RNA helicase
VTPSPLVSTFPSEFDKSTSHASVSDHHRISEINVTQEGLKRIEPIKTFKHAGLHPAMLKNIELSGFTTPTPIQKYCIPAIKMGHDLIAIAQTGKKSLSMVFNGTHS